MGGQMDGLFDGWRDRGRNEQTDRQMPEWIEFIGYMHNDTLVPGLKNPALSVDNLTHAKLTVALIYSRALQTSQSCSLVL